MINASTISKVQIVQPREYEITEALSEKQERKIGRKRNRGGNAITTATRVVQRTINAISWINVFPANQTSLD